MSEADAVRDVLRVCLVGTPVRPRSGIFVSQNADAEHVDDLLAEGFGL